MTKSCASPKEQVRVSSVEAAFDRHELGPYLAESGLEVPLELWEAPLLEPVRAFFERPRKDFRAELLACAFRLAGGAGEPPNEALLLIETLHAGSLIVDDIQDGSTVRRGAPALHLEIGEPLAINAANWMYFYASALTEKLGLGTTAELELKRAVNDAVLRCHMGQALDLGVRLGSLPQRRVQPVVRAVAELKTGGLLELAARTGALLARADAAATRSLAAFGTELGVGLQMFDDLSGIYDLERCHKGHEDLLQGRPTWPWAWLAQDLDEVSFTRIQHLAREVERHAAHPEVLALLIRDRLGASARRRARGHMVCALDGLRARFGRTAELEAVEARVAALEASYG